MSSKRAKGAGRAGDGEEAKLQAYAVNGGGTLFSAAGKPALVAGIGLDAGEASAVSALLSGIPAHTGMAFVIVAHGPRAPGESSLSSQLRAVTSLPVREATHEAMLEPDHVYVAPPGGTVTYAEGRLLLSPEPSVAAQGHGGTPMPIDVFLRSLAIGRRSRAVAVILAGAGADGALGVQAIREAGGIAFIGDESAPRRSAGREEMPLAAIGAADFVLPPEQIAAELATLPQRRRDALGSPPQAPERAEDFDDIFAALRAAHDVDFSLYRHTTVRRRIQRRMVLNEVVTLDEYASLLRERPAELGALYQDILVRVTHFFRDPDVFAALKRHVFPALLRGRAGDTPLRIWVPGCSTGEEAYSLAIALLEASPAQGAGVPFQIFATDVHEEALETARAAAYIENIAIDVSPERLRRFFVKEGGRYRVVEAIRERCVFARHDLTRDPPLTRIDLVSCRNALIYLEPVLERRVLPRLHQALRSSGYLVLGASETVGGVPDLFSMVDRKSRIYAKNASTVGPRAAGPRSPVVELPPRAHPRLAEVRAAEHAVGLAEAQKEADLLVMNRYAPPGVIIDGELSIVQFRGHNGPYLEPAPGEASLNVLKMAREGLALELRAAIHKARRTHATVWAEGIQIRSDGQTRVVSVEVIPLHARAEESSEDRWLLILFHEGAAARAAGSRPGIRPAEPGPRGPEVERELAATKEYLQVAIEEQEALNEELQSTNEELFTSNEALQSMNEALETAKEELEAANQELAAINQELRGRNGELDRLAGDFANLLAALDLPIVVLGRDLRIRRFTAPAARVLGFLPGDVGRHLGDLRALAELAVDLLRLVTEVVSTAQVREREVQDREGHRYSMRVRPCRTPDDRIDGAVVVLVDEARDRMGPGSHALPAGHG